MTRSMVYELCTSRQDEQLPRQLFPLEFAWPAFFDDWCVYREPSSLSWVHRSSRHPFQRYGMFTRKSYQHELRQKDYLRLDGFEYKIPGTMFMDRVMELEWDPSRQRYIRVHWTHSVKQLPSLTTRQVLSQLWASWGRRHAHWKEYIDTNTWIFRTTDRTWFQIVTLTEEDYDLMEYSLGHIHRRLCQIENEYIHQCFFSNPSKTRHGAIFQFQSQNHNHHQPCLRELPNMKYCTSWYPPSFIQKKKQLALQYQDWSLIPYMVTSKRQWCLQRGIPTLRHLTHHSRICRQHQHEDSCFQQIQRILHHCFGDNMSERTCYLHRLIWIQTCPFAPQYYLGPMTNPVEILDKGVTASIDFEWIPSFSTSSVGRLYLIGVYIPQTKTYKSFWASFLSPYQEIRMFRDMFLFLESQHVEHILYYFAEEPFFERWLSRIVSLTLTMNQQQMVMEIQNKYKTMWKSMSTDIYSVVTKRPVVIRGSYTAKLKDVHNAMWRQGFSEIRPLEQDESGSNVVNALDSIEMAKQLYRRYSPVTHRQELRSKLERYNQQDCPFYISNVDGYTLRQHICDYLQDNPVLSSHSTPDQLTLSQILATENITLDNYVKEMRLSQTWGGAIEIRAFCDIFNVSVHISLLHYPTPIIFTPFETSSSTPSSTFTLPTLSIFYTGDHYEPKSIS